jgi:NADP-dependent 3-hydroxy acid dehydrogenase YdfG
MAHVLITGASAGFGQALARLLEESGPRFRLSLGARRAERLSEFTPAAHVGKLDVTDVKSCDAFLAAAVARHGPVDVLVNNAGLARGTEKVSDADGKAWREMIETNVVGVLNMTRRVLPSMLERKTGHVVMLGSVAGHEAYEGGSVYCATKRALQSIAQAIRLETLGSNIRVTSVDPGLAETEFSVVRFSGDEPRAKKVYEGMRPLTARDVAEVIHFAITRPAHVNLDMILVKPTDQAAVGKVHRSPGTSR